MIRLEVPVAPGEGAINLRFATVLIKGAPRLLTSKRYRAFKAAVAREAKRAAHLHGAFPEGPVAVAIVELWPKMQRAPGREGLAFGDVDAPLKAVLDGLTLGGLIGDDGQVVEVYAKKRVDAVCPRVLVSVWRI